jgi:hypothetical protein
LSARAKFCPNCGTTVAPGKGGAAAGGVAPGAAAPARGSFDKSPWIIAGLAVLALVATIIVVITKRQAPAADAAAFDPNRGTTDITSMSPREAADRLFDRTARAAAAGDSQQVLFFGPMTIQAYGNVTPLDPDARLHIGLVQLNLDNPAGAVAQADSITRESRTHLFAFALRAQAAIQRADAAAARRAYQDFLRNEAAERAKNLPEYQQHIGLLDEMKAAAQGSGGEGSAPR